MERFELPTPWSQTRCANRTALHPVDVFFDITIKSGERGIRTPGTGLPVRQFSKLVVSATHPPLQYYSEPHFSSSVCNTYFVIASANVGKCFNAAIHFIKKNRQFFRPVLFSFCNKLYYKNKGANEAPLFFFIFYSVCPKVI